MRIGILSASLKGERLYENQRLMEEISAYNVGGPHEPVLINYRQCAVAVTQEGRRLYQYDSEDKPHIVEVDAVIPRIGKFVEAGTLVLKQLYSKGLYTTATPEAVVNAKDKASTAILLDSVGLPIPYTLAVTGIRPKEKPLETLKLIEPEPRRAVILKKNRGSHGTGVALAESRRSAISQFQAMQSDGPPNFVVQEFLDAPDNDFAKDIRVIVVDGNVVAAMMRSSRNKDEFRANLSQGGEGSPYDLTDREAEYAIRAAGAVGLSVAGVDMIPSHRGSLVNEVNVSPEFGIEKVTGINVAQVIARLAIDKALERATPTPPTLSDTPGHQEVS